MVQFTRSLTSKQLLLGAVHVHVHTDQPLVMLLPDGRAFNRNHYLSNSSGGYIRIKFLSTTEHTGLLVGRLETQKYVGNKRIFFHEAYVLPAAAFHLPAPAPATYNYNEELPSKIK